jgi:hypothetical protein
MYFSASSFKRSLSIMQFGICLFTSGCVTSPVNATVQPQPTCISATANANPYLTHPRQGAVGIYEDFRLGRITYGDATQKALSQLGKNTDHWSDQVDLAIDENNMIRIVVTYLDPVLIEYILLNQNLADAAMGQVDFGNELGTEINELGGRNEMLFIVTITTPFYREQAFNNSVLTVRLPIEQMTLISASDVRVPPTHEDHILDEQIDITHGPVSGIVGYPLAIVDQGQCLWIIDPSSNTLTLDVPSVTLGTTVLGPQFWNIPYRPLIKEVNPEPIATFDPYYDQSRFGKIDTPPTPTWRPNAQNSDTNWTVYWEDMGRYIWNLVITESHH